jgi:hypothetical protein
MKQKLRVGNVRVEACLSFLRSPLRAIAITTGRVEHKNDQGVACFLNNVRSFSFTCPSALPPAVPLCMLLSSLTRPPYPSPTPPPARPVPAGRYSSCRARGRNSYPDPGSEEKEGHLVRRPVFAFRPRHSERWAKFLELTKELGVGVRVRNPFPKSALAAERFRSAPPKCGRAPARMPRLRSRYTKTAAVMHPGWLAPLAFVRRWPEVPTARSREGHVGDDLLRRPPGGCAGPRQDLLHGQPQPLGLEGVPAVGGAGPLGRCAVRNAWTTRGGPPRAPGQR